MKFRTETNYSSATSEILHLLLGDDYKQQRNKVNYVAKAQRFENVLLLGEPNDNFQENICSEDDLRSRIFGTFVVKFLACLPLFRIFEHLTNGIIAHF